MHTWKATGCASPALNHLEPKFLEIAEGKSSKGFSFFPKEVNMSGASQLCPLESAHGQNFPLSIVGNECFSREFCELQMSPFRLLLRYDEIELVALSFFLQDSLQKQSGLSPAGLVFGQSIRCRTFSQASFLPISRRRSPGSEHLCQCSIQQEPGQVPGK